jgi:HAD superfamily hydrolase (TIGR01549 family)
VIPRFRCYLFDIDGTLLDSAADICGAMKVVLAGSSQSHVEFEFLRRYIGHHLIDLFEDLFPGNTDGQNEELIRQYRAIYPQRGHQMTRRYPGVKEALMALDGLKSTATTKGTPTARAVLELFDLLPHFDHVQGTDGFPSKPAPDVIHRSLEALGVVAEECLLVGDAAPDMEAGRRAGVKVCAVRYGYGDHQTMARWEPDYWIDDLRELLPDGSRHSPRQ